MARKEEADLTYEQKTATRNFDNLFDGLIMQVVQSVPASSHRLAVEIGLRAAQETIISMIQGTFECPVVEEKKEEKKQVGK